MPTSLQIWLYESRFLPTELASPMEVSPVRDDLKWQLCRHKWLADMLNQSEGGVAQKPGCFTNVRNMIGFESHQSCASSVRSNRII